MELSPGITRPLHVTVQTRICWKYKLVLCNNAIYCNALLLRYTSHIVGSKRHSLPAMELSRRSQTNLSKPPAPAIGDRFTVFVKLAIQTRWMTGAAPHKIG